MEGETQPQDRRDNAAEAFPHTHMTFSPHLPVPPTVFIGREREVAEVCALLGRANVRLVTLMGPGGIGKTRLALAVADALRGEFPDDVYYVSLAPLTDPALVLPAIAQGLGIHEPRPIGGLTGQATELERLLDAIGHRRILLVLDNFEQVIEAAGDLAALVNGCARLKVLVTSREMLRISAEHLYHVPPMTLPDLGHLPPLEFLAQVEAVRLFVTRAQAAQPDFTLTTENGSVVAAICHRLDGLPLAIELAAARTRLLPPPAMLDRLERRLALLTGGPRDAPERHQTLRAAIGWSYDLLSPNEQQMFRRLAVFVGGCTLEAVEQVCGVRNAERGTRNGGEIQETPHSPTPSFVLHIPQLIEVLASLMDKSLMRQEQGEEGRLELLETIREFALEQLEGSGEGEEVRKAHALYYLALAEEGEAKVVGPDQEVWLDRLEREHDNLRAALAWALGERGVQEIGARLAAALWGFWLTHGHLSEGRRWLDEVLAHAHPMEAKLRARVLNGAGRLALRQGEFRPAQAMMEESLALWREVGDARGELLVRNSLGLVAIHQDDFERAQRYFEENLVGWRALGDKQGTTQALNNLGLSLRYQDKFAEAETVYEECLALARELPDKYPTGAVLHNLGQMLHQLGDDARAHTLQVESLLLVRQIEDRPNISVALMDLAGVWASQGDPVRAAKLFGAAEALRDKTGATLYEAQRRVYERDVALGAAQLEKEEWEAAWAEGRAMPLDEVCALAIEELPARPETQEASAQATAQAMYELTEREMEVLRLLVAGLTYAEMAQQLMLSFHTIHAHLRSIYSKLGVTSRSQATRFAAEHGLG